MSALVHDPWPSSGPDAPGAPQRGQHEACGAASILIVDDEPGMCSFLRRALEKRCALLEVAADVDTAEALRKRLHFDLLITDIRLPGRSGVQWVEQLRDQGNGVGVIFMTAHADLETAIAALRVGAADFILKPFRVDQMIAAVERCLEQRAMRRQNYLLRRQVEQLSDSQGLVGQSAAIRGIVEIVHRVAPMPSTVLLEGESGTGKELVARAIHDASGRGGSFVAVNCGSISPELLESELFGHVRGAFTGAHQSREGLFSYAAGGTLFLDEIGEMAQAMQSKLLRALEERTIRPVGANRETPVDVRIIAATNRDLGAEVRSGRFREDLFYRLNVLSIQMPPLREHLEDVPVLARHFLRRLAGELGIAAPDFEDAVLSELAGYEWPGNVRELRNVIERCLLLNRTPAQCLGLQPPGPVPDRGADVEETALEAVEKRHILRVLDARGGNKSEAARRLGISRKTLERKLQAWNRDTGSATAPPA
ncbi:MAG: sigma-54-dependent Fis family transcriptional regulator [Burkholderiales bacterium]|nr:MAG: sigma-54-dependent Fis family transcriptional regulator [Burkholderiales bacterium]